MRKNLIKKATVLGIMLLFVGTGIVSAFNENQPMYTETIILRGIWYVGGYGENNLSTIKEAIDLASDGDIIYVYNYSAPYKESNTINKPLQIIGENDVFPIIDGDIRIWYCNEVVVKGFTFLNTSQAIDIYSSSDIIIQNNFFKLKNNKNAGITISISSRCTIKNNTFDSHGIKIVGSKLLEYYNSHTIENNYVDGRIILYYKDTNGIVISDTLNPSQIILANCYNFTIQKLDLYNVINGMIISFSNVVQIFNNNIFNCFDKGIFIMQSDNITISKNDIYNNSGDGIVVELSYNVKIIENSISSNYKRNGCGITISKSRRYKVENNRIFNTLDGIFIDYCIDYQLEASKIINNTIYNNFYGILVLESQYLIIQNNIVNDSSEIGIILLAFTPGACFNIDVFFNEISNNRDGISLVNSNYINFQYNLIRDNSNRTIILINSRWNIFYHNNIYGYPPLIDCVTSWTIARSNYWGRPMILPWLYMRLILSWVLCFPPLFQPSPDAGPQS
jgi:parallel beta-helix repeat protein